MPVETHRINIKTRGDSQVLDLTPQLVEVLGGAEITNGVATLFVIGSTAGITTTEYEPGLVNHDLKHYFGKLAPEDAPYLHEETWHDDNGHAHVRASLLGPSLSVPFVDRRPTLAPGSRWSSSTSTRGREREKSSFSWWGSSGGAGYYLSNDLGV